MLAQSPKLFTEIPVWHRIHTTNVAKPLVITNRGIEPAGRGFPGVTAQSVNVTGVWHGRDFGSNGISAAAPIMAGVVALSNDYFIASGSKSLGFMNPWLYKVRFKGFADIVSGSNWGRRVSGFSAVDRWNLVTGFRTLVSSLALVI
jgi:tripeptidyl-peptidase-1